MVWACVYFDLVNKVFCLVFFHLDEFFGYLVRHLTNYALYFKKQKLYEESLQTFHYCNRVMRQLESSLNPTLLHICAKARIPFGIFYLEFGK